MKFIVISYFTKGTRYQQCADRLRKSLDRLTSKTLFHCVHEVENLGTWQKNTHFKPVFIFQMLKKYGVPVLYVDADAVFHRYPDFIEGLDCDVAAYFYQGEQLASGTLYFAATKSAETILERWIEKNTGNPSALDQANLQEIMQDFNEPGFRGFRLLPAEYCKIFDLMPEVIDPVIEHFQASREMRNDASLVIREKEKYVHQWAGQYKPSVCAPVLAQYLQNTSRLNQVLLDIGCGNGLTVGLLRAAGFFCDGVDITLRGKHRGQVPFDHEIGFHEAPVWQMPFKDDEYDYTFSTDVLEHLPTEMVDASIQEIYRVTREKTFHCIATFPHEVDGVDLHLTVRPIEWWKERFAWWNRKGIETTIVSRDEFLKMDQTSILTEAQ